MVTDRLDELLRQQGKTQKELIQFLGLCRGTYTHWKKGNNRSYIRHIAQIAQFFQMPIEYFGFLYGEDSPDINSWTVDKVFSDKERNLILNYRKLRSESQNNIYAIIEDLAQAET